ncbi:thiamine diphosphokinase [Longilinea arvoryzae]|uniref:Thiamine diphosphokinase n=1 Tax=Longilinea arvoryzae TaxID=360412 RepID=A0A0S7B8X1_9CHLR|nr:thiamine diphosphokinase [Longilinea arvoryzae]GAP13815.1 thiamine diphosphokinase [Longilinea arvoryzae]
MPTAKRAVIFVNGRLRSPGKMAALLRPEDVLIAVDGGLHHLRRLGLPPHLLIGDLDSANAEDVHWAADNGAELRRYPREKDETDLELALQAALQTGSRRIVLAAALGGRLDQTLGNLFLLMRPELAGLDVRLEDGMEEVFLIREQTELRGRAGEIVSLLPLNGPAVGVKTRDLRFPLNDETLYPDKTRGISNEMTGESAGVSLRSGLLLCIHTRRH